MNRIIATLENCGIRITFRKAIRTLMRYGMSRRKMYNSIFYFSQILRHYGIVGNLFIPAEIVESDKEFFGSKDLDNIRLGAHGLQHIDYSALSYSETAAHLSQAISIFKMLGMGNVGFRAPYGRITAKMLKCIRDFGYAFDSSQVIPYENYMIPVHKEIIQHQYLTSELSISGRKDSIIKIPFSMPDDEFLVDRLNLKPTRIGSIWGSMLQESFIKNRVFVLQLHPNRINELAGVLRDLIEMAISHAVRITDLNTLKDEYISNGYRLTSNYFCITGDIDAVSLRNFIR